MKTMLIVALIGLVTLGVVADDTYPDKPLYPAYDINQNGVVEILDVVIASAAYGSTSASPKWNPAADVVKDGVINIFDITTVASHFAQVCPQIGWWVWDTDKNAYVAVPFK